MVVMAAADEAELSRMVATSVQIDDRPSAFRYPRGNGTGIAMPQTPKALEIGKGRIMREGRQVAILSLGTRLGEALDAAEQLAGLSVLQLGAEAYVRRLRSASRVTRLESLVCGLRLGLAHLWCSLALQRWRKVVVALAAEAVLEADRRAQAKARKEAGAKAEALAARKCVAVTLSLSCSIAAASPMLTASRMPWRRGSWRPMRSSSFSQPSTRQAQTRAWCLYRLRARFCSWLRSLVACSSPRSSSSSPSIWIGSATLSIAN